MKKSIRFLAMLALILAVVGVARTNPAWADAFNSLPKSSPQSGNQLVDSNAAQPMSIIVTGSGSYLVGGVCKFDATFVASDIKNQVDAEAPIEHSQMVPFLGEDDLYYPGCHVVQYKQDKVVEVANDQDGDWKICFGKRPDIDLVIYYYKYSDTQPNGSESWIALPTTVEGDYSCASAIYTGVYMPAGRVVEDSFKYTYTGGTWVKPPPRGSVRPPAEYVETTQTGTKGIGGICSLEALYKVENLKDDTFVEFPVEDNLIVNFPNNGDILLFPGCHVLHYEKNEIQKNMPNAKGEWTICFAAPPDMQVTIYYYESLAHIDEHGQIAPSWNPLPTTIENGLACAPAEFTGVYVPAGH
jgi:hypothetical protein